MQRLDERPPPPLARMLLMGSRWFDAACAGELVRQGWPRLSPAQTLVFAVTGFEQMTVPALARRLGHSRQATHQLVKGLVDLGLYEITDDPRRRGGRLLGITQQGTALALSAYRILLDLEATLGPGVADTLRAHLGAVDFEHRPVPALAVAAADVHAARPACTQTPADSVDA